MHRHGVPEGVPAVTKASQLAASGVEGIWGSVNLGGNKGCTFCATALQLTFPLPPVRRWPEPPRQRPHQRLDPLPANHGCSRPPEAQCVPITPEATVATAAAGLAVCCARKDARKSPRRKLALLTAAGFISKPPVPGR